MNKLFIVAMLCTFIGSALKGQEVLSSAGYSVTNGSVEVSWSIGEPISETFIDSLAHLTQGFNQSDIFVTRIDEVVARASIWSAYPNPAQNEITIQNSGEIEPVEWKLQNLNGQVLSTGQITGFIQSIQLNSLASGIYFITLENNKSQSALFKIIKQ
ncbi:MAG TPA: hypothetical protein DDX92_11785 [Flavobacteriales bacterium]|jgi:hypothetical protein|nr:hypothetical protein [Flavobacteriales bacterium]